MNILTPLHRSLPFCLSPLALLLPLLAAPALAAPVAPVEELVVTATKRDQALQEVSAAVTVVNRLQGINSLAELAPQVPGLRVLDAGARNSAGLVIRGLRFDEVGDNELGGDGGLVASYIDNIPLQGFFVPPALVLKDLQQVEVLRGPQGTLYGNASIGGLVRYVTAKPELGKETLRLGASLSQTRESHGLNYDTELVANAPLSDSLALRVMLSQSENQGFIDNDYFLTGPAEDINGDQTDAARLGALWQASENFSLTGSIHYQELEVDDRQADNKSFTGGDYQAAHRFAQPMEGELKLYALDADYQLSGAKLSASLNRYSYDSQLIADQTDYLIMLDEIYGPYYTDYPDLLAMTGSEVEVDKDSAELRLVSDSDQPWRWLAGVFVSRDELDVLTLDLVPGFGEFMGENRPFDLDYVALQEQRLKETSAYGELAYDLLPEWELALGARHFRYDDQVEVCSAFFPLDDGETEIPLDCLQGDDQHTGALGKISSRYRLNDQQQVYVTVSEGFRRGGANPLPATADSHVFYDPDTVINYELGTRGSWWGERLQLGAALFQMEWDDIQLSNYVEVDGDWYGATFNGQQARSRGLELEAEVALSQRWGLSLDYTHQKAELTRTVAGVLGGAETAYQGDRLPGSPEQYYRIGLDYRQALGDAKLEAQFSLNRIGDAYTALNDEFYNYRRLDAYTTANARLDVILRNWRLGAFATNIANERAITGGRSDEFYGERGQFDYVTRPRTLGVSASYQF